MAQYYTLEEAAQQLGMSTDEFRRRLATEWRTTPRRYPDGATLRFQTREIDELARTLGHSSEAELQLGEGLLRLADDDSSAGSFVPLAPDRPAGDSPSGSKIKKKSGSDSDVRLDLSGSGAHRAGRIDSTDDVDLDAEQRSKPPSSKRMRPPPAVTGDAGKKPDGGSDFDLSLTSDSSDEFELQLTDDSDEVDIGVSTGKGLKSGDSGINLQSPADSGISLEKSSDFELALEGGPKSGPRSGPKTSPNVGPKSGPKTKPPLEAANDESEFELTLDDSGIGDSTSAFAESEQKDIFETDFELPALDDESGSEAVALEESDTDLESSDFDLSVDDEAAAEDSGSEVVAIDEEDETVPRRRLVDEDEEFDELEAAEDYDRDEEEAPVRAAASSEWGLLPALALIPCVLIMFLVGLMSWELVHGMWGYQQPGKATGPVVRFFAEMFGDGKLPAE